MIKILPDKTILDRIAEIERLRKQCEAVKLPVSISLALRKNSRKKSSYGFGNLGSLEEYFSYDVDEYYRSLQMDLPPLFYDGRENPPHPEIWVEYFLRMMVLYAKKVAEISLANAVNDLTPSLTHLDQDLVLVRRTGEDGRREYDVV